MKTKAYLFDFDGTLVDTMEGFADIAGRVINQYHPEMSFETARSKYLETSGVPFYQQLEILFPGDSGNSEKVKIFEEEKKDGFFSQKFSDDVRYAIDELRKRGHLVGVSSNNFQDLIDVFVKRESLTFDVVLGYRDGFEKGKDHFDYIMKKFSLQREELTFVGDSLKDAEKAIDNGIYFIGLTGPFFKEKDFKGIEKNIPVINSIKDLLSL